MIGTALSVTRPGPMSQRKGSYRNVAAQIVTITWKTRTNVALALLVRPYNCPKAIEATVALELSSEV